MNVKDGIVRWFNDAKGFGFIKADNEEKEFFVHFKEIVANGYRTLKEGDKVSFKPENSKRGLVAKEVTKI